MAAFDAGSIESTLTLDRSPFQEGLRLARAEGEAFESQRYTATADVDTDAANSRLAELVGASDYLDGRKLNLEVDVDAAAASAELAAVGSEADALDGRTIGIGVDQSSVDAAKSSLSGMLAAIVGLGPALAPLSGVAAGGLGALASSFAAAAGAIAPAALAIVGAHKRIDDAQKALAKAEKARETASTTQARAKAQKEYAIALKATQGPMAAVIASFDKLNAAYETFLNRTQANTFGLMSQGLQLAASVLPRFAPLANAALRALTGLVGMLRQFSRSRDFTQMLTFFRTVGVPTITIFGRTIGNLVVGLGRLLAAFGPLSLSFSGGLLKMSQSFAAWAGQVGKTAGFQRFVEWLRQTGPVILRTLMDLGAALVHVGIAIAPVGVVAIKVLDGIARAINLVPTPVIGMLAAALATLLPAIKIVQLLSAAFKGLAVAMAANPVGVVIAAIAALAIGLIYAYKHSETFRRIVNGALTAVAHAAENVAHAALNIRDFFVAAWRDAVGVTLAASRALVHAADNVGHAFGNVGRFFTAAWRVATNVVNAAVHFITYLIKTEIAGWRTIISAGLGFISGVWRHVWNTFGPLVRAVFGLISATIGLHLRVIQFSVSVALYAIRGVWQAVWGSVRAVTSAVFGAIRAVVTAGMHAVRAVVSAVMGWIAPRVRSAMASVRAIWSAAWNAVRAVTSAAMSAVRAVVGRGVAAVLASARAIARVVGIVSAAFQGAVNAARGRIGALVSLAAGIGGRILGAVGNLGHILFGIGQSVIQGLIDGITSMIGKVTGVLHHITDLIPKHKGPRSKDKTLLTPAGVAIIEGLIAGLNKTTPSLISTLNRITAYVARAGAGRQLRALVRRDTRELEDLARQRDRVASHYESAMKHLADLQKQYRSMVQGIADNIVSSSSLTALGGDTLMELRDNLAHRVQVVQQFAQQIALLRRRHLNNTMLQQLASEGPDQAGATVNLLAGAGKAQLAQFNQMQRQISGAALATGRTVAGSMYNAGLAAARGVVRGLRSQLHLIVREMRSIAIAMVRAIRHQLKIHSPSDVLDEEVGQPAGMGVHRGLKKTQKAIMKLMAELVPTHPRYRLAPEFDMSTPRPPGNPPTPGGEGTRIPGAAASRRHRTPVRLVVGKREFDAYIEEILDDHDDEIAGGARRGAR